MDWHFGVLHHGPGARDQPGLVLGTGYFQRTSRYLRTSNFTEDENTPYVRKDPAFAQVLPTQTLFLYEFTTTHHGHRRDFLYLSDGGHFDNTAAYELSCARTGTST